MARWGRLDRGRIILLAVLVVGAAAFATRSQWDWIFADSEPETRGVFAAPIAEVDSETERLYRIRPDDGSVVSYTLTERLAGTERTTTGATTVVAGDIAVNTADPARSRVGEIVVNVEMLDSDSNLRDKRLRHDYLESSHWPFARFAPVSVKGLDAAFADGATYDVAVTGDLTVKETTRTETFAGSVTVGPDRLVASVSAVVLTSDYGVGPIHIARLAHTSDEVTLAFDLVARRVELGSPPEDGGLGRAVPVVRPVAGAFAETVQPILEHNCVSCHTAGGPGHSTVALDTAADAAAIADDIALVVGAGFMPPWLPSDLSPEFEHDWSLTEAEKAAIAEWAQAGGGLDVAGDTPLVARSQAVVGIEEDQTIGPRDGPYTGYARPDGAPVKRDDYRCQVHEVADPEGDGTWVRGFEFRPDQTDIVHHAIVYRAPAAAAGEIADRIAAEDRTEAAEGLADEPGWTCFGLSGLETDGVWPIQGWAPGQSPTAYPEGYGLFLAPGDMIVNQIHFHFDHDTRPDESLIILDEATPAEVAAGITHISGDTYLTPAEVPCTPAEAALAAERAAASEGYVNMCERGNVLDDVAAKYGLLARFIPDALILLCGGTVDDYDDLDGTVGYSSCDLPAQNTGVIHTVLGHMHELGAAYRMTLHPETDRERILLDIPEWDFEWQLNYEPVEDIRITEGDTVRFECWWDRSLQYMAEPRYVTWNEGTGDEMCFSSITVLPTQS